MAKHSKKKRPRMDLVLYWRKKLSAIAGEISDREVSTLARLIRHPGLGEHEKYLVLEGAILDIYFDRLTAREEERREQRKRDAVRKKAEAS